MTKSELSPNDVECLEIGRGIKLAGMRLAIGVLREQMELLERQARPPAVNGAIKPAMLRTLLKAGIELPALPAPARAKGRGRGPRNPAGIKGYWAKMTAAERSAEMKRRQAVAAGTAPSRDSRAKLAQANPPRVKLVQPNHPRNLDHPDHAKWVAKIRKANRKSWESLTPEQRQARNRASLAGRGLKPKVTLERNKQ